MRNSLFLMALAAIFLAGCGTMEPSHAPPAVEHSNRQGSEVVMYAMGLMDIDYRFGGQNPDSGLDCSGMVSFIYKNAVGMDLPHNAYQIAQMSKKLELNQIRPGDLVFFDTQHRPFSHIGIYIGEGRFIHAPGTNGKIKISTLASGYFAKRLNGARTLFN